MVWHWLHFPYQYGTVGRIIHIVSHFGERVGEDG